MKYVRFLWESSFYVLGHNRYLCLYSGNKPERHFSRFWTRRFVTHRRHITWINLVNYYYYYQEHSRKQELDCVVIVSTPVKRVYLFSCSFCSAISQSSGGDGVQLSGHSRCCFCLFLHWQSIPVHWNHSSKKTDHFTSLSSQLCKPTIQTIDRISVDSCFPASDISCDRCICGRPCRAVCSCPDHGGRTRRTIAAPRKK